MVSILPSARGPWDLIGESIGSNLSNVLPGAVQQGYNRGLIRQGIDRLRQIANDPNASPLDITFAAMEAGSGIQGSERYLGPIIPELVKFAEARRGQVAGLPGQSTTGQGQEMGPRDRTPIEQAPQRQQLPGFLGRSVQEPGAGPQNFPTNLGANQAPGNLPQQATGGIAQPLLSPAERIEAAKKYAQDSTAAGIPMKPREALEIVNENEEQKRLYNDQIERERLQRVESQKTYGSKGLEALNRVFPSASPILESKFQQLGEREAAKGRSEGEINQYLSGEAKRIGNSFANAEKQVSSPRLLSSIGRAATGSYRNLEEAGADARQHLRPFLEMGLYDEARSLLEEKGYGPEERESIINPLSERAKITLNAVPEVPRPRKVVPYQPLLTGPGNVEDVKKGLIDLQKADPNFSLVLARKAFEDKNYDWSSFKNALNDLEDQGFDLTDDQKQQRVYLDTPPLNALEKILHGLNLIGR